MDSLLNERQHDNLPSTSKVNPSREGIEHYKEITLRSGKELERPRKSMEEDMEVGQSKAPSYNSLLDLTEVPFPQRLWRLQGKGHSQNEEKKNEDSKEIQTEKQSI